MQNTNCGAVSRASNKIYLVLAFLIMVGIGVLGIVTTKANFSDIEGLANNLFAMGNLHFNLSSPADFSPQGQCEATPTRNITITNLGNPFRYKVKTANASGALCQYLTLQASVDGVPVCSGSLTSFECDNQVFPEIAPGPSHVWTFTATYGAGAPSNSSCSFDFAYSSWQMYLSAGGFTDEQTISNLITKGDCVPVTPMIINKIYYDVACDKGTDPDNEWIEIYNPNAAAINLKNWKLCSQWSCETVKYDSWIPAHGYAVASKNNTTWNYWTIPADVTKISQFKEGDLTIVLDNDNGMVFLVNPAGAIVDQMNYGTPDPAWPFYNANVWNPGVADGGRGHALGRYPVGTDTNTVADWKDYAMPSITITSVGTTGMYISGYTYTITWASSNPSGPDNSLLVDLYYIMDTNNNNYQDSGDQVVSIAKNLNYSGSYNLTITGGYHFFGYVWIRAIVRNTDNFMVTGMTRSRGIFEPDSEDIIPPPLADDDLILDYIPGGGGGSSTTTEATSTDPVDPNATTTDDGTGSIVPVIDDNNGTSTTPVIDLIATEEQLNATSTIQADTGSPINPPATNSLTPNGGTTPGGSLSNSLPVWQSNETATSTDEYAADDPKGAS
jgi:hypothetical protein